MIQKERPDLGGRYALVFKEACKAEEVHAQRRRKCVDECERIDEAELEHLPRKCIHALASNFEGICKLCCGVKMCQTHFVD